MTMKATLFVDSSFHAETGAAGYGAWIKARFWVRGLTFGGPIAVRPTTSHEAEICGIANAVARIKTICAKDGIDEILVQCDSLRALGVIRGNVQGSLVRNFVKGQSGVTVSSIFGGSTLSTIETQAVRVLSGTNLKFHVRHVRGHKHGTSRESLNNLCDTIAKEHMRTIRAGIRYAEAQGHA